MHDQSRDQCNVRLVKGQTYQFVFWAQKSGAGHYDTSNMKAISVDYNNISNDESRDAFYTFVGKTKVTGPFSQDVTLKRPFAQLNLGTTAQDWGWAQTAGVTITDSKVKVTGEVYSTLNTFDGTVAGETPVEFTLNAIPSQGDLLVTDNKFPPLALLLRLPLSAHSSPTQSSCCELPRGKVTS